MDKDPVAPDPVMVDAYVDYWSETISNDGSRRTSLEPGNRATHESREKMKVRVSLARVSVVGMRLIRSLYRVDRLQRPAESAR